MTTYTLPMPAVFKDIERHQLDQHTVIEASAGTGKTYTLKHLVLELLLANRDLSIDQILIVTFTRRATGELRTAIRDFLGGVVRKDPGVFKESAGPTRELSEEDLHHLHRCLLEFDKAQIYTIHSFCQHILVQNAFLNGQLFQLKQADEEELVDQAFQELLRGPFAQEEPYKNWLSALLHADVSPRKIGTDLARLFSLDGELQWPEEKTSEELLLALGRKEKFDTTTVKAAAYKIFLPRLRREVQYIKDRDGLFTFHDMLTYIAETLRDVDTGNPRAIELLSTLRRSYRYALIDEFQDTDAIQWEIFRRIFVDSTTDHTLYLIGDPKQAIYSFRGADVWTYLRARDEITDGTTPRAGRRLSLKTNFRSTAAMVEAYNTLFDQNREAPFFSNPLINYPDPVDSSHFIEGIKGPVQEPLKPIQLMVHDGEKPAKEDWKNWIALEIKRLLKDETHLVPVQAGEKKKWRPLQPGDIYVLTNSNAEGIEIGEVLAQLQIPHSFYRQEGLFQSPQATHFYTLLQAIADPTSRTCRRRAFLGPFFNIPMEALLLFDEGSPEGIRARRQLRDWNRLASEGHFSRLFDQLFQRTGILCRELLLSPSRRSYTNYLHLWEFLLRDAETTRELPLLLRRFKSRIDQETDEEGDGSANIQRLETDQSTVQIMTMHKAKGLQSHVVFVYGFGTDARGIQAFIDTDEKPQEAKRSIFCGVGNKYLRDDQKARFEAQRTWETERLIYVAITRAISLLYLPYASHQKAKTGREQRLEPIARVLDGLPDHPGMEMRAIPPAEETNLPSPTALAPEEVLQVFASSAPRDGLPPNPQKIDASTYLQRISFSGVKAYSGEVVLASREEEVPDEELQEEAAHVDQRFSEATTILGGGPRPGNLLHDILENLDDYGSVLSAPDAQSWLHDPASPEILDLFQAQMARYGYGPEFLTYTARIIFDTLRAPYQLPAGPRLSALADAHRFAKEIPFHFPIPEEGLDFKSWPPDGPRLSRGWVEGYIDLTFTYEDRVYIADWKSNTRPNYSRRALASFVDEKYGLQAKLYTLAMVRLLGIQTEADYDSRFGGCAYIFLRGVRPDRPGEGIVWTRPTWEELNQWNQALLLPADTWKKPTPVFTGSTQEVYS